MPDTSAEGVEISKVGAQDLPEAIDYLIRPGQAAQVAADDDSFEKKGEEFPRQLGEPVSSPRTILDGENSRGAQSDKSGGQQR